VLTETVTRAEQHLLNEFSHMQFSINNAALFIARISTGYMMEYIEAVHVGYLF